MKTGIRYLHLAASNNDVHLLEYGLSLKKNQAVDVQTDSGWTAAQHASLLNNWDSLNLLLEYGADLTIENEEGTNAFGHMIK